MNIDDYRFGQMTVDGTVYTKDLIILPGGKVQPNWWREEGHRLARGDLETVFETEPDVLVIGTGAHGVMKVPIETRRALDSRGIEPIIEPTPEAIKAYNDLQTSERRVAAAFHLTC